MKSIIRDARGAEHQLQTFATRRSSSRGYRQAKKRRALKLLLAALAIVLAVHVSSGLLRGLSLLGPNSADLSDLLELIGNGVPASSVHYSSEAQDVPKLIPRIIHQTYRTRQVPDVVKRYMQSWKDMNPGWEVRFYDDQECLEFVKHEFPEYLSAYKRLPRSVERSDFFRYMVVLRHGGVYADIDTECREPLDSIIRSKDTLIVGWENEFPSPQKAVESWYARTRQVLQWVFAGAPGHPALRETCDRIAASVRTTFSSDANMDVLEKTGPGVFTDVVLKHSDLHPPSNSHDPWSVRILPRVAFGAPRKPAYGLTPRGDGVAVQHGFLGSWRLERRWWLFWRQPSVEEMANRVSRWWTYSSETVIAEQVARLLPQHDALALYPVSADFDPPFDIMTHLQSHGEKHSGWDVSSALTAHGSWQPSVQPYRRPSVAEALVGSLGAPTSRDAGKAGALVDIGAGYGFVTLAAAARGHKVHAFELGAKSTTALEASIERNGFEHLVQVHKTPLGAVDQQFETCLQRKRSEETSPVQSIAAIATLSEINNITPENTREKIGINSSTNSAVVDVEQMSAEEEELSRGYALPEMHVVDEMCISSLPRSTASKILAQSGNDRVGAIRISANGWEGWIIEGLQPLIEQQRPPVIAVEWNPSLLKAAGYTDPLKLIETLHSLGYTDISHSGYVCDERWYAITYGIRRRGGVLPEEVAALKQPTWCRLTVDDWHVLIDRASGTYPETLLFVNKGAGAVEQREDHIPGQFVGSTTSSGNSKEQQQQGQQRDGDRMNKDNVISKARDNFISPFLEKTQTQQKPLDVDARGTHTATTTKAAASETSSTSLKKLGRKGSTVSTTSVESALKTDPAANTAAKAVDSLTARSQRD